MTPTLNAAMDHREEPRWHRRALRSRRTRPWRKGAWDRGGPKAAGQGKVSLHVAHRLWPLGVWSHEQGVTQWRLLPAPELQAEPSASGAFRSQSGPESSWTPPTVSVKPECLILTVPRIQHRKGTCGVAPLCSKRLYLSVTVSLLLQLVGLLCTGH